MRSAPRPRGGVRARRPRASPPSPQAQPTRRRRCSRRHPGTCGRESSTPRRRRARRRPRYHSLPGVRRFRGRARHAARRAWSPARHRSSWNKKSLAGNGLGSLRNELLDARPHLFGQALDGFVVEWLCEPDDEAPHAGLPMRADLLRDLIGSADDGARRRGHPVVLRNACELCLRLGLVVANDDTATADRLDLPGITTADLAVLFQNGDLARHDFGALEGVPHVRVASGGAKRALLPATTDEDRQSLLDRPCQDLSVDELVVVAGERHSLAIDKLANDLRPLREAIGA